MSSLGNKAIMAKNIKYYMEKAGVNQTEICNTLGFKMPTFSDWVNAKTYPRIDKIELMANYFGISKADLVEEHDDWKPTLSKKEENDINKKAENFIESIDSDTGLMFNGEPIDDETRRLFKNALEVAMQTASLAAKKKFTPKKNRK